MTLLSRPTPLASLIAQMRSARTLPPAAVAKPAPTTPTPARASPLSPTANTAPVPATAAELTREFSDEPAFIVECLAQRRTMDDAHKAHSRRMKAERDRLAAAHPKATAQQTADGGEYMAEVNRVAKAERISLAEATSIVNRYSPDLRLRYIENNRRAGRARN